MTKLAEFLDALGKRPELSGLKTTFSAAVPQYYIDLDRNRARESGKCVVKAPALCCAKTALF